MIESLLVVELVLPDAPDNIQVTEMTNTSCTLKWNAPRHDGGSPVTGYYVEMYCAQSWTNNELNNDSVWTTVNKAAITRCCIGIDDLLRDHEYWFRVRAENAAGVGPPSEHIFVFLHVTDVPGCPPAPEVTCRRKHEATLTLQPPDSDGGSAITGYIVEMKSDSEREWKTAAGQLYLSELKFVATGLKSKTSYEFRVAAVNESGPGEPSPPSTALRGMYNVLILQWCNMLYFYL